MGPLPGTALQAPDNALPVSPCVPNLCHLRPSCAVWLWPVDCISSKAPVSPAAQGVAGARKRPCGAMARLKAICCCKDLGGAFSQGFSLKDFLNLLGEYTRTSFLWGREGIGCFNNSCNVRMRV